MLSQFFAGVGVIVLLGFLAYLGYDTRRRTLSLREAREKSSARKGNESWTGWVWVKEPESEPRQVWVGERGAVQEPDPEIVEEREPRRQRPVRAAASGQVRGGAKSREEEVEEIRRSIEELSQKAAAAAKRTPPKSEEDDG